MKSWVPAHFLRRNGIRFYSHPTVDHEHYVCTFGRVQQYTYDTVVPQLQICDITSTRESSVYEMHC